MSAKLRPTTIEQTMRIFRRMAPSDRDIYGDPEPPSQAYLQLRAFIEELKGRATRPAAPMPRRSPR